MPLVFLDREGVPVSQFLLFLLRSLRLMMAMVVIAHMCSLYGSVAVQELIDSYVILFGCVHPFHDHQLIFVCFDGCICRTMSLSYLYDDRVYDWFLSEQN
jgi:hypothetical protein